MISIVGNCPRRLGTRVTKAVFGCPYHQHMLLGTYSHPESRTSTIHHLKVQNNTCQIFIICGEIHKKLLIFLKYNSVVHCSVFDHGFQLRLANSYASKAICPFPTKIEQQSTQKYISRVNEIFQSLISILINFQLIYKPPC